MGKTEQGLAGLLLDDETEVSGITRDLDQPFNSDVEAWKKQEEKFVKSVMEDLEEDVCHFARTDSGWRGFLRTYAEAPDYSPTNMLWARIQLAKRGVNPDGKKIMSESAFKALGRRVKEQYAKPMRKRDRQMSYDNSREWDTSHTAEMIMPFSFRYYPVDKVDANGNPVIDPQTGQPEKEWRRGEAKGFKTFLVYHEDATEGLDGGEAPPIGADAEWKGATGSEQDALKLFEKVKFISKMEKVELEERALGEDSPGAVYRPHSKKIVVNTDASSADQATLALRSVFIAQAENEKDGEKAIQTKEAAAESAKYVVASLFGLDSDDQSFPHIAAIADGKKGSVLSLTGKVHKHVSSIMGLLDLDTRKRAQATEEESRSRAEARRKRRAKKKK